jgi:uncharacterized membrane protein YphA (DoxX/SURF4 family)
MAVFIENIPGWVVLICRLILGFVFVYASLDKLANPAAFAQVIEHYHILPFSLLHSAALLLPVVEFVVGCALILGFGIRGAALLTALMTMLFMVGLTSAIMRDLDISCGCFHTDGGHGVGVSLLWRDAILLLLCIPPLFSRALGANLGHLFLEKR